jgi:carboxylesterase type B
MPRSEYKTSSYLFDAGPLGHIEGLTVSSQEKPAIRYFGGLPYALPPVGPFRYRRARQLPPCYRYGTKANPGRFTGKSGVCPQPYGELDDSLWDENCLQLNIYIPAEKAPKGGWPVFFFIHGGRRPPVAT